MTSFPPKLQHALKQNALPARLLLSSFGQSWDLSLALAAELQGLPIKAIEQGQHADTLCLRDEGLSFKVGAEHKPEQNSARGLIEWISKKPVSPRRIVILEHVERASDTALQALLKILEEPPSRAQFILTTQNHHRLLPTILSRVTLHTVPHNFDDFPVSAEVKDFLESPDLMLKFTQINNLRIQEKEDQTGKPIMDFVDQLLLHARYFPQYHQHLEKIFQARQNLQRNINPKLALETLAMELTKP